MISTDDRQERENRADRLKWAREHAKFTGPKSVSDALNISVNTYKAHETGRNDYSTADARAYARLFKVSLSWLYLGIGSHDDANAPANAEHLQDVFERLANAPEDVQSKIVSYAEFELDRLPKSLETATSPQSSST